MIGRKIKKLLTETGIKQIRFAEYLGISPSRLSNYISDKREPDLEMLAKMASCLGVDMNYFADMKTTAYPQMEEIIHTDSADSTDIVDIPVKCINADKDSSTAEFMRIDKKLIPAGISDIFVIELTESIRKPLLMKGDYLLVCPLKKHKPEHGDLVIVAGCEYRAYRVCMYKDKPFIIDFEEGNLQKLADLKGAGVYVVLLFMLRG